MRLYARRVASGVDDRLAAATPLRRLLNKVFPDHWSFLLGEIALYSFIVLLLSGVYLALFFDPSMAEVTYDGAYTPLRGLEMSRAYESTLDISFEVRGGLFMRQMHHWAALLFGAAILIHMLRVFFTGAFRRPRELNWAIGVVLLLLACVEGLIGYSLPDDGLSGTGLRIASAVLLSIPVIGSWLSSALFDGEFPGTMVIGRFYLLHVLLLPGVLLALITAHLGLLVKQKHTQWPGPGRTERNVVGVRMAPAFAAKAGGFFMIVFAVIAVLSGLFQINPVWVFGPYQAGVVSSASQPDWYMWWLDGALRLFPPWEARAFGYTVPTVFFPAVVLPGVLVTAALLYPWLEARFARAGASSTDHHLLQRPRDAPQRTALGAMAVAFYLVLTLSTANDVIAEQFHISLNAMTWAGRIGLLLAPPVAYWVAYRLCLALQQHDREVLVHGVETGIIRRLPDGGFVEIHQPLGKDLEYRGSPVPKKMNRLGALAPTVRGFFVPIEKPADRPAENVGAGSGALSSHTTHRELVRSATRRVDD
ncbi:cytochrome bc1 complex cytochrome b subunit [Virgisporangium aurantiacum]|uniref:Cytochrome bc1 complex cytochrome b subunit n=1 Tax=Virgisporangium aurantiacum TaxID=175570 RepID=A0A8J3ZIZ1_9ACTN|nr:cytochrome bc complex cytochrome b subunit [Virgisporangium aurantiacum]GIJ63802.1 ubiquinol-cytochrome c reductase cytochrome b subunit [Virgisporangium aurantiacum]